MKKQPRLYTLRFTQGNMTITGVHEGTIGAWVARLGGNDLDHERLLMDGKVKIGLGTLSLHPESTPDPDPDA
jgi:hypothetical protein